MMIKIFRNWKTNSLITTKMKISSQSKPISKILSMCKNDQNQQVTEIKLFWLEIFIFVVISEFVFQLLKIFIIISNLVFYKIFQQLATSSKKVFVCCSISWAFRIWDKGELDLNIPFSTV